MWKLLRRVSTVGFFWAPFPFGVSTFLVFHTLKEVFENFIDHCCRSGRIYGVPDRSNHAVTISGGLFWTEP